MSRSRLSRAACGTVLCCLAAAFPLYSAASEGSSPRPAAVPALGLLGTKALAAVAAPAVRLTDALRPKATGVRVALISSGVDPAALPESLRGRISHPWGAGDQLGLGTYSSSVLLQLADQVKITSLNVFEKGSLKPARQVQALEWAAANAKNLDVVMLAASPHEFLDPVSEAMQSGYWKTVLDVSADQPLATRSGLVMGIPMDAGQRAKALEGATTTERAAAARFAATVHRWQKVREVIASISSSGVSVVSPAGDLGPGLQTVLGVANLPEVISVGGFDGRAVSASSASGPSIDGSVKPDLIAPSGIVGVLPESSALAKSLDAAGVLSPSLSPLWDAGDAPSRARARLDSSLTSATLVAAATGG
ncbi:MAG TPA: S8 family serine peptidase, partial [Actinomycetota bacterium]|nr:S8 family serine peptidase [Actinomycetota bacterium]